jgi:formate C-acetyltransferase
MTTEPYFRPPGRGPDCSTPRSARLRERRFRMGCEARTEPPGCRHLAEEAARIFLAHEERDPALARALALRHVVERCDITIEKDTVLLGGEDPFFFNLLLPTLQADRHSREGQRTPDESCERLRAASAFLATCFEGHITPGLEFILRQGIEGLRQRIAEHLRVLRAAEPADAAREAFYQAALLSCESILIYARRYQEVAEQLAAQSDDEDEAAELHEAARILARVPAHPARNLREALQSYWIAYLLTTLEMGGCCPGGGLGLGRLDQFLLPYYQRDIASGELTRAQALELIEIFLLAFRHADYYTPHQPFTPGSQASLGGVTARGGDASNELTELIMQASLRIAMPAPYISLRLHRGAPPRYWQAAASYIVGGLGFPIVNDEVLIPALLRHGRSLSDARDYICSCCYENTIPGREAFHPNAAYLNLPLVLEFALNEGCCLLSGERIGCQTPAAVALDTFADIMDAFTQQLHYVGERMVALVNHADRSHMTNRRYPLMSLFIDDCLARGQDVCAGGARYNLTGCIVAGLPNVINSLAAIRECVFRARAFSLAELIAALRADFAGHDETRRALLAAPKWGNGDERVDNLATTLTDMLYREVSSQTNPRGGRWQLALYSFVANLQLGQAVGASADGRRARAALTRNLNPALGTDRAGPTAVLGSLSRIDFTQAPNGSALDLRFEPAPFRSPEERDKFAAFLKAFVELGVMEMQITMVDTETLLAARDNPQQFPHLMVKVAGYSARFIDLPPHEQEEIIRRTMSAV